MQVTKYLEFRFEILYSSPFREKKKERKKHLGLTLVMSQRSSRARETGSMKSRRKMEFSGIVWARIALLI